MAAQSNTAPLCANSVASHFIAHVTKIISADPGLPRANPTVSSWQLPEHRLASHQSAELPECTDFAIIGSGITGTSVSQTILEHASAKDAHITIFEARTLVSGATGRNGGHLVTASGHTFGSLSKALGEEAAKQITRFSIMNIEYLINMVAEMSPEVQSYCQIRNVHKVMAVGDDETWQAAKQSVLAFQKAVPEYSTFHRIVEKEDVGERWNIKNVCGAVEHEAGAIWPYRLITSILERLLQDYPERVSIEANTPVLRVERSTEQNKELYPYRIFTPRGVVHAKKVVHCTNGHAPHLIPGLTGRIYPFRGTMTVQKPGPHLKNTGATRSWSLAHKPSIDAETGLFNTGLYYLQQNALTGSIWIGNETDYIQDALTADDTVIPEPTKQVLSTVLPNMFLEGWGSEEKSEIESIWSGIQGHTADGLPVVGQLPVSMTGNQEDDGQWIAAGFNGYGMDKCWLTGKALGSMILGDDVSDWFPTAFRVTEERLQTELTAEKTVSTYTSIAFPNGVKQTRL